MNDQLHSALHRFFGFSAFRPLQEDVINALLSGKDTFVLMPTGGGKSLCYQLPATIMNGITLVISPLIALMKDQVDQLNTAGIPATLLSSTLEPSELQQRSDDLLEGKYKLLYVSPERLVTAQFMRFLAKLPLRLFAVDEAHCISEWGHDFRAEYQMLSVLKKRWPKVPLIAMTATATARVQHDILDHLGLQDARQFRASFNRPNMTYLVRPKADRMDQLLAFLSRHKDESGIIYCMSRDATERLATALENAGYRALPYHAGLDPNMRSTNQERFSKDDIEIVCATIAFGMGINKSNVRFVVHWDLPKHLAGYYQETGRAGRDGLPAECMLFFSLSDRIKIQRFIDEIPSSAERVNAGNELDAIMEYAQTQTCRRVKLLAYFDEAYTDVPCGGCDNCLSPAEDRRYDATREAQMFLSCVVRLREQFGVGYVIDVLRGKESDRILSWRHHQLPTFGIGIQTTQEDWKWIASELIRLGYLRQDHANHSVLKLTPTGSKGLKREARIELHRAPEKLRKASTRTVGTSDPSHALPTANEELFQKLRELRRRIAEKLGVAPFIIFHDTTLHQIAARLPLTLPELLAIPGLGETKAQRFGEELLQTVKSFADRSPQMTKIEIPPPGPPDIPMPVPGAFETKKFLDKGHSIYKTAELRGITTATVVTHATQLIANGDEAIFRRLVSDDRHKITKAAFEKLGWAVMKPVLEYLKAEYSSKWNFTYVELQLTRAYEAWTRKAVRNNSTSELPS